MITFTYGIWEWGIEDSNGKVLGIDREKRGSMEKMKWIIKGVRYFTL